MTVHRAEARKRILKANSSTSNHDSTITTLCFTAHSCVIHMPGVVAVPSV